MTLVTSGIMQIGWTNLVGDDAFECDEGIGMERQCIDYGLPLAYDGDDG